MRPDDVPFSSQYADLGDHEWRARGCGVASLKMMMDFWHGRNAANRTASLDELLRAGLAIGAHMKDIGWTHRGLVELAKQYGYEGYNMDLAPQSPNPKTLDQAWTSLVHELERGPVMVSVWRYFEPEPHGGHMVVVTGWDGQLVALNDPIEMSEREGRKLLALESFLHAFKQRYVVIRPRS
jgi:hypothetical protein